MEQDLKKQEKELSDDISSLNKKVCCGLHFYETVITHFKVEIPRKTIQ